MKHVAASFSATDPN